MNGWNKRWKISPWIVGGLLFCHNLYEWLVALKMYQLFIYCMTLLHFLWHKVKLVVPRSWKRPIRPTSDGFQSGSKPQIWRSLGCTIPTNVSQFLEGCVPIDVGFPFLQKHYLLYVTVRRSAQSQFFEWRCKDHLYIFAILEMSRCVQKDKFWVDLDGGADSTSKCL